MRANFKVLGIGIVIIAVVVLFALTGIPYKHFNWTNLVSAQNNSAYNGSGNPGCQIDIPNGSVVGSFVSDTQFYWSPNAEDAGTMYSVGAGTAPKTAWVIGLDAGGNFYKIVWGCQYLWVPQDTMGPNYDAVWQGIPLPTRIVE
jgi:hypothetical protein